MSKDERNILMKVSSVSDSVDGFSGDPNDFEMPSSMPSRIIELMVERTAKIIYEMDRFFSGEISEEAFRSRVDEIAKENDQPTT